jgi:integrase
MGFLGRDLDTTLERSSPRSNRRRTIDMIIAASSPLIALKLSISKETAMRPVELLSLKVNNIDL